MNEPSLRPFAALLLAPGITPALAQESPVPDRPATTENTNAAVQLPEMVVEGQGQSPYQAEKLSSPKYTAPLRDIPQSVTVIPRAVMEEQGATSLRDVLRNVPGISMQAGEGGGGLPGDNLSIRGFNARSDIYVDGVRDYGAYSRDPFNVEQVEVTKGPSSSYGGRGTTGGAINLSSKAPRLDPFYGGTLGFGSDSYQRMTLDFNQPFSSHPESWLEQSAFRLNVMGNDADTPGRDVVKNSRWAVAPALGLGLGTPTKVTLSYLHMIQDNVPDYGIPWVPANTNPLLAPYSNGAGPVNYDNFYGLANYDFEEIENDQATAIVEHDFGDSLSLRNLSRYGRTYRNSAITAPRFADVDNSTLLNRQLQQREIENEVVANQTDANLNFKTGPMEHAVVAGFEFVHEHQDNRNSAQTGNQPQTDFFNPTPSDQPFGPMPAISGTPSTAEADTLAPYLFDTIKLGEHWEVNGGARFDHIESEHESGGATLGRTDDLLSWRAGIVFKPRENGSIYFGYGTSFDAALDGNTGLSLSTNANNFGNVNLDPEEARSFELGAKWDFFNERLSLNAAVFRTEKVNARTRASNGDPVTLDGEQMVQGIEFGVSGSITANWNVFAGYAYLQSEIKQSNYASEVGAEFGNTPKHSFNLWTTYQLPWHVQIGGGANYVGERFNNSSSNANARRAPAYWLFDAMLAYEINKNFTLRLNAYNLADERYIDRVGGGHFVPGAGRSAMLTAEFKF